MKMFLTCFLSFLFVSIGSVRADGILTIGLGKEENQLGVDIGSNGTWKPLFFSIDEQGNVRIPDFYKSRIAIFDSHGRLIRSLSCPLGISPRMNYFAYSKGVYITYDSNTLFCIREDGSIKWRFEFPPSVLFSNIFANTAGIQLFPSNTNKNPFSVYFGYDNSSPIELPARFMSGRYILILREAGGKEYSLDLSDMPLINGKGKYPSTASERMSLVFVNSVGMSVWSERGLDSETVAVYNGVGNFLLIQVIRFGNTKEEGSGFWSYVTEDMKLYKAYFTEKTMEIQVYDLNR
jgi:hypothetical protein